MYYYTERILTFSSELKTFLKVERRIKLNLRYLHSSQQLIY